MYCKINDKLLMLKERVGIFLNMLEFEIHSLELELNKPSQHNFLPEPIV